jgi:heme/copper-type cytochrome/quinol oxidase subunit 3
VTLLLGIYCILLSGYEYDEAQSTVLAPACVSVFLVATGVNGLYVIVIILVTILYKEPTTCNFGSIVY